MAPIGCRAAIRASTSPISRAIGNPNVSNPFLFRDNQYVANANLSYIRGAHNFRFGGEYTYYDINHFQPQAAFGPRGGFNFTGGVTSLRGGAAPGTTTDTPISSSACPIRMGKDVQYINPSAVRMPGLGILCARSMAGELGKLTVNFGARFERYPFARATIAAASATIPTPIWC